MDEADGFDSSSSSEEYDMGSRYAATSLMVEQLGAFYDEEHAKREQLIQSLSHLSKAAGTAT